MRAATTQGTAGFGRWIASISIAAVLALVIGPTQPASAAGLLIAEGGFGGVLEIEEHSVRATLANGIAVTEVTQVFRNTENRIVEALYTFPIPEGASVANFSMWIDGKEMVGEVLEKERAREIYNSYKQERRDPGLLEQVDYKRFEMRIFPIAAGAEQRVQIAYYQELDFDHDRATYVYPLATVTHEDLGSRTTGRFAFDVSVRSPVPIVALDSPSHGSDMLVVKHGANDYQASLETTGGDLNRDLVVDYQVNRPRTGLDLITSRQDGEDGFFQLTLTAGDELERANPGADYVFLLDVSGSMDRNGKLALSRGATIAFVEQLALDDRFELLAFNVVPRTLFGKLEAGRPDAFGRAGDFLEAQQAQGGTVLQPALELAYQYKDPDRFLNVVILSDGMTEQAERPTLVRMIGARPPGTRVFCIGVGNEVNRPLLSQLAEDAGGLAAFLSRGDDFQRRAESFRRKLMRPAVGDLAIALDNIGAYDLVPERLPDLFHGAPVRLYGRYKGAGPSTVRVDGTMGGDVTKQTVELDFPDVDASAPEIERMWAWHRIQDLDRAAQRGGRQKNTVVNEIVRLGEAFSIVTEHTSFLVLENDAEYKRWRIERRNALRLERDRTQQRRLRAEIEAMRSAAARRLGPIDETPMKVAAKTPQVRDLTTPESSSQPRQRRSADLGGGALDPMTALLMLVTAGLGLVARRRPSS